MEEAQKHTIAKALYFIDDIGFGKKKKAYKVKASPSRPS